MNLGPIQRSHSDKDLVSTNLSRSNSIPIRHQKKYIDELFLNGLNKLREQQRKEKADKTPCCIIEVTPDSEKENICSRITTKYTTFGGESFKFPETQKKLPGGGSGALLEKTVVITLDSKNHINTYNKLNRTIAVAQTTDTLDEDFLSNTSFVRKTFPLLQENLKEAKANFEMRANSSSSIIKKRIDHEVKVLKYGVIINLNKVTSRTEEKDTTLKIALNQFYSDTDIEELKRKITKIYPELKSVSDIELFYDMQWCNSGNIGSQLIHTKNPEALIENLVDHVDKVIDVRVENSRKIETLDSRKTSYLNPFGIKLKDRLSNEALSTLDLVSDCFGLLSDRNKLFQICKNLINKYQNIREQLSTLIEITKETLYPEYTSLEVHDDMNLGNLMGDIAKNELIYIDNGASTTEETPINSEMIKLLFAFGHQGILDGSYELNEDLTMTVESEAVMRKMLNCKEIFINKIREKISLKDKQVKSKLKNFLFQSEFFSIAQHISDGGYIIKGQLKDAINEIKNLNPSEDINKRQLLETKLKILIHRCHINMMLFEKQIGEMLVN